MSPLHIIALAILILAGAIHAAPKTRNPAPIERPAESVTPSTPRVHEFSGDDISLVLRALARQAKMNVVIDNRIAGTVNLRLEDKTPRQAIETIANANGLLLEQKGEVFYIRLKNDPPAVAPAPAAQDASLEHFSPPHTVPRSAMRS